MQYTCTRRRHCVQSLVDPNVRCTKVTKLTSSTQRLSSTFLTISSLRECQFVPSPAQRVRPLALSSRVCYCPKILKSCSKVSSKACVGDIVLESSNACFDRFLLICLHGISPSELSRLVVITFLSHLSVINYCGDPSLSNITVLRFLSPYLCCNGHCNKSTQLYNRSCPLQPLTLLTSTPTPHSCSREQRWSYLTYHQRYFSALYKF